MSELIYLRPLKRRQKLWLIEDGDFDAPTANHGDQAQALLIKEMDETNSWARAGLQAFYSWFTIALTADVLALGWLIVNLKPETPAGLVRLIFLVFIAWNLLGFFSIFRFYRNLQDFGRRSQVIVDTLHYRLKIQDLGPASESPVPQKALRGTFLYCALALATITVFWVVTFIYVERVRPTFATVRTPPPSASSAAPAPK